MKVINIWPLCGMPVKTVFYSLINAGLLCGAEVKSQVDEVRTEETLCQEPFEEMEEEVALDASRGEEQRRSIVNIDRTLASFSSQLAIRMDPKRSSGDFLVDLTITNVTRSSQRAVMLDNWAPVFCNRRGTIVFAERHRDATRVPTARDVVVISGRKKATVTFPASLSRVEEGVMVYIEDRFGGTWHALLRDGETWSLCLVPRSIAESGVIDFGGFREKLHPADFEKIIPPTNWCLINVGKKTVAK